MYSTTTDIHTMTINFGPQHPAAHGVLRLLIELDGEVVQYVDPHIGLLHRGSEKLIETKNVQQALPYFDRFDYVSMMAQEHVFACAVEKLFDLDVPSRAKYIRVLFLELTRILNHLLAITTHALDVGALTPFLWGFEEREFILSFYEAVSGARMHAAYICPGGVAKDLSLSLLIRISDFIIRCNKRLIELHQLLSENRIWKIRLSNVGVVSKQEAIQSGFSGVLLRGSGINFDLRLNTPYEIYNFLDFKIPLGIVGDCMDRYLIRLFEIQQSLEICNQCIYFLSNDQTQHFKLDDFKLTIPLKSKSKLVMESLIHHFKSATEGVFLPKDSIYFAAETPKGELGVLLFGNNDTNIYRCSIRAPGFYHLQSLPVMAKGGFLADLVTIIGTQDIVFGEIDR